jgi:hypothetical protein
MVNLLKWLSIKENGYIQNKNTYVWCGSLWKAVAASAIQMASEGKANGSAL